MRAEGCGLVFRMLKGDVKGDVEPRPHKQALLEALVLPLIAQT